jgi:hypothetical protein
VNDRRRSIAFSNLAPLISVDGMSFVSLQKGEAAPTPLVDLTAELGDFADTAALIECLDLVITVDTAVAHLAGTIGKPTWVMLPTPNDWRWLVEGSNSPWYPSVRLFRQQSGGEWTEVVRHVTGALRDPDVAPTTAAR